LIVTALLGYAARFRKGAHVCVQGALRSRGYTSDGGTANTYEIVASSILNLRAGQRNPAPEERP
jgi:single-stranded DNA-binding protein